MEKIQKFNKRRVFNKAVGPGKNPKLINVGPTFIPDYRVRFLEYFSQVIVKCSLTTLQILDSNFYCRSRHACLLFRTFVGPPIDSNC